ncbi:MAG: non-ribosomal peptide synthetase, partial [Mycoplasmatales bacterium]
EESIDSDKLAQIINDNEINVIQTTPSRYKLLLENPSFKQALNKIDVLITGGEELPQQLAEDLLVNTNIDIYNAYGPTETTIWSTISKIENSQEITIGKPIANTEIYILDNYDKLVPIGSIGELAIAGAGVSRGYKNSEQLTQESFIKNPFGEGMLYKTGDLAKWNKNGELIYKGRKDNQIKLRGHRIEVQEIEAKLKVNDQISEAVVLVKEINNNSTLVAYLATDTEIAEIDLKTELRRVLPEYMIPSIFVKLTDIPLTANGKIDRKKLLELKINKVEIYVAPTTANEILLVNMLEEILEISKISITDDFFAIGGDSIKAIQMTTKLRSLGYKISINEIMGSAILKDIASKITYKAVDDTTNDSSEFENKDVLDTETETLFNLEDQGLQQDDLDELDDLF